MFPPLGLNQQQQRPVAPQLVTRHQDEETNPEHPKGEPLAEDPSLRYPKMIEIFGPERTKELESINPEELAAIIAESSPIVLNIVSDHLYENYGLLFQFGISSHLYSSTTEDTNDR